MTINKEFQAKAAHGMAMPRFVTGTLDLASGSATEALPEGFDETALMLVSYSGDGTWTVGNAGMLRVSFVPATSILTVTSSNAADDNTVRYMVMQ